MVKDAFSHVSQWVFDLDNTLYPPRARLFDQIEVKMTRFVMDALNVDRPEADREALVRDDVHSLVMPIGIVIVSQQFLQIRIAVRITCPGVMRPSNQVLRDPAGWTG